MENPSCLSIRAVVTSFETIRQACQVLKTLLLIRHRESTVKPCTGRSFLAEMGLRGTDLKKEAPKPPGKNFLQQQAKFDRFVQEYNHERPHQALGMRYPAELYTHSARRYQGLLPLEYPLHDQTITVTQCGRLCFSGRKINLSVVFAGQYVGVREVADHVWLVSFMHYDLGFFDDQEFRVECAPNPFGAKVLPMSPE